MEFAKDSRRYSEHQSPCTRQQCPAGSEGDHILGARLLRRFVPQESAWVHVDLSAGENKGGLAHVPTNITGFGVRFTLSLLESKAVTALLTGP